MHQRPGPDNLLHPIICHTMHSQIHQQLLSGVRPPGLQTQVLFGGMSAKQQPRRCTNLYRFRQASVVSSQQQHVGRHSMLSAQAAPKSGAIDTSILTENPIGKLLAGLVGTPVFVAMEVVALLVMLGLTDAGYSGDWSRIGAITTDTELLLQKLAIVAWSLHGVCGLITANIASSKGRNPVVAAVKGVLFGSLHVFEELVLPPAEPLKGTAVDNPTRRR